MKDAREIELNEAVDLIIAVCPDHVINHMQTIADGVKSQRAEIDRYRELYETWSNEATERKKQIDQQLTQIDQLIFIIGQIRILVNGVQPDSEIVKSVSELINSM